MALVKDWIAAAAEAIAKDENCCFLEEGPASIRNVIEQHCPFKPGVAYMPVPRCDSCRFWERDAAGQPRWLHVEFNLDVSQSLCSRGVTYGGTGTPSNFGCVQFKAKE